MISNLLLQATSSSLYTNNTTLLFGVLLLAAMGYWYYRTQKKNPNLDFGPLMATQMVSKHESIFMGIIFLEYLFAAMVATTVHNPLEHDIVMSPLGRMGMHIIIAATGTVAQFTLSRDIAIQFTKMTIGERAGNLFILFIITLVAFGVPYANLMLIASAGGESLAFDMFIWHLNPFVSEATLQAKYLQLGLPPNYRPWANLSGALQVCIVTSILAHYLLAVVEGLRTITSPNRRKILMDRVKAEGKPKEEAAPTEASGGTNVNSNPMPAERRNVEQIVPNAEFLLKRLGYTDATKISNLVKQIQHAIVNNGATGDAKDKDAMALAYRMSQLRLRAASVDASTESAEKKKELKDKLLADIRQLLGGKAKDANGKHIPAKDRGLGITLKNS